MLFWTWTLVASAVAVVGAGDKHPDDGDTYSFDGQCRRITLSGGGKIGKATLAGECLDGDGQWWKTQLNLNNCVGTNEKGKLQYKDGGNFDTSCRPCILKQEDDVVLQCSCKGDNSVPKFTTLQLEQTADGESMTVQSVDGGFVCGKHSGDKASM